MEGLVSLANGHPFALALAAALCLAALLALHRYYARLYQFWSRQGVRGPRPAPVVGNLVEILRNNRMLLERRWAHQYGKVYGIYLGNKPRLVVADVDVLRQICVKDFDSFPNHDLNEFFNKHQKNFLIFTQDQHWKRIRAMLSPTFTSGKIKRMYKLLEVCAQDLVHCFNEQLAPDGGQPVGGACHILNLKDTYSLFTIDAIATCCYGLKMERSGASTIKTAATRNDFVAISLKLFQLDLPRLIAVLSLPKQFLRLIKFQLSRAKRFNPLVQRVESIIKARRESGKKFDDYLQILLDAKFSDKMELNEMDLKENHHAGLTHNSLLDYHKRMVEDVEGSAKLTNGPNGGVTTTTTTTTNGTPLNTKIELTDDEILSNAMFLLVVGLETTATLLTHCSYLLAFHQDIQEKLYEQIKSIAELTEDKKSYTFDYETLTSCQYLDSVISESLRVLSPVITIDRVAKRDYHIDKYNIDIAEGTKLDLAFYSIMNDPDYWPNPEKFDPDRFMPGNRDKIVPGSYCPFGLGPRHCLGMRFSLTESKLALAKIVMNFRFEPAPGTTYPPEPKLSFGLNGIKKPLAKVIKRSQ